MKNLNELLEEKALYSKKMQKLQDSIRNFDKPICPNMEQMKEYKKLMREGNEQQAAVFYTSIKEITEKNRKEKKVLEKQKNIYQLAYEMVDINIMTAFETLHKKKILDILNKYVKKRIGQKTKEKIEEELKEIDENIKSCYLCINNGLVWNDNNVTFFYGSNFNIKIELNKDIPGTWLNEDGQKIENIYNFYTTNYKYIDNILQLATEKIEEKEKLEKEIEKELKELKEKIRNFNNFFCKSEKSFIINEYNYFR